MIKAKEKAMKNYQDNYQKVIPEKLIYQCIDIALEEQAKEIFKDVEEYNNPSDYCSKEEFEEWLKIKKKYGVKDD